MMEKFLFDMKKRSVCMNVVKSLLLLIILIQLPNTLFAASKDATMSTSVPDIEGNYICKGRDPFANSNYVNYFSIKKTGDTYSFNWVDKNGYPTANGTGISTQNLQDKIAVAYVNMVDNTNTGIIFYKINADGSLTGIWTVRAETSIGTDNCKKR